MATTRKSSMAKRRPNTPPANAALGTVAGPEVPAPTTTNEPNAAASPEGPTPFDAAGLERVKDIIRSARTTWFAMLGALAFASVTLAGVSDVGFFVSAVQTKLPLVDFTVPVSSFFWVGSLLVAAMYAYFHLYLELLWQALGDAPSRENSDPKANDLAARNGVLLADRIEPWIVADTALSARDWLRKAEGLEKSSRTRALPWISGLTAFGLVWLFGPLVIAWFWWRSMPAHDPWLTGFVGLVLASCLWVSLKSAAKALECLSKRPAPMRWKPLYGIAVLIIALLGVARTWLDIWEGQPRQSLIWPVICGSSQENSWPCFSDERNFRLEFFRPARADLREAKLVEIPKDWSSYYVALADFRGKWCKETPGLTCENPISILEVKEPPTQEEMQLRQQIWREFSERRKSYLDSLEKASLRNRDLRGADLTSARLEGVDLSATKLGGATLDFAYIEPGSAFASKIDLALVSMKKVDLQDQDLSEGNFRNADFSEANLRGANLSNSDFSGANLSGANLQSANLTGAKLDGANLDMTDLQGANLDWASLKKGSLRDAKLRSARLSNANLANAYLVRADLSGAMLQGADLDKAILSEAKLFDARLNEASLRGAVLTGADLTAADLEGARLEDTNFAGANLSRVRLFGTPKQPLKISTNFKGALFSLAAIRFAEVTNLTKQDLRDFESSFGDATVQLPTGFARPCNWASTKEGPLDEGLFYGRWRSVAASGGAWAHIMRLEDYDVVSAASNCQNTMRSISQRGLDR
jgi:uncharacterized protein YjbI with pentapeptide repeats